MKADHTLAIDDHSRPDFDSWDGACACGKWWVTNAVSEQRVRQCHAWHLEWIESRTHPCPSVHPVWGKCHDEEGHQGRHWSNGMGNWIRPVYWSARPCPAYAKIDGCACRHCTGICLCVTPSMKKRS